MAELVADCSRCGAKRITFDLTQENLLGTKHGWQQWYEAFCVCRHCARASIFILAQATDPDKNIVHKNGLVKLPGAVNQLVKIEGIVSKKDDASVEPPKHLPEPIEAAFHEGATCLAVDCYNAAGTMFRLCVDLATQSLLPKGESEGLNSRVRRDLGLRLPWLFANNHLPTVLHELSTCIKDDGNDGAHAGTLGKGDAEDLLDFTTALLERLYSEPEVLKLAKERRNARRVEAKKDA